MKTKLIKNLSVLTLTLSVSACSGMMNKLDEIGTGPKLEAEKSPIQQANYQPITNWPAPVEPTQPQKGANSLWQTGARSFFKDQRATRVGDILTVQVAIADKADLDNQTENSRDTSETTGKPTLLGLTDIADKVIPLGGTESDTSLASISSKNANKGAGKIGRKESIETKLAATITQVLPNGNLVIKGVQQIKVNHELREIALEGVIRPEDISSDNTIQSEQIAEARISYGGRGTISDSQQARYGYQVFDAISPF
jgi:flagellar L-ring protein precursor FlgH